MIYAANQTSLIKSIILECKIFSCKRFANSWLVNQPALHTAVVLIGNICVEDNELSQDFSIQNPNSVWGEEEREANRKAARLSKRGLLILPFFHKEKQLLSTFLASYRSEAPGLSRWTMRDQGRNLVQRAFQSSGSEIKGGSNSGNPIGAMQIFNCEYSNVQPFCLHQAKDLGIRLKMTDEVFQRYPRILSHL